MRLDREVRLCEARVGGLARRDPPPLHHLREVLEVYYSSWASGCWVWGLEIGHRGLGGSTHRAPPVREGLGISRVREVLGLKV